MCVRDESTVDIGMRETRIGKLSTGSASGTLRPARFAATAHRRRAETQPHRATAAFQQLLRTTESQSSRSEELRRMPVLEPGRPPSRGAVALLAVLLLLGACSGSHGTGAAARVLAEDGEGPPPPPSTPPTPPESPSPPPTPPEPPSPPSPPPPPANDTANRTTSPAPPGQLTHPHLSCLVAAICVK